MSKHGAEAWEKRVGGQVPWDVSPLLSECIILQQQRDVYTPKGRPIRILALLWHPGRGLVFKIDFKRRRCVTVLTLKVQPAGTEVNITKDII